MFVNPGALILCIPIRLPTIPVRKTSSSGKYETPWDAERRAATELDESMYAGPANKNRDVMLSTEYLSCVSHQ